SRGQFKGPRYDQGNWKTEGASSHDDPDDKIRNLKEGKNLRGHLNQEPCDNSVSNGDAIYVASLEFGKKLARLHSHRMRVTFSSSLIDGECGKVPLDGFPHNISILAVAHRPQN